MNCFKINGRNYWFDKIEKIERVGKSKWLAVRYGVEYRIEGGRHAGGSRNEWFLDQREMFSNSINCTSLIDALKLIENM